MDRIKWGLARVRRRPLAVAVVLAVAVAVAVGVIWGGSVLLQVSLVLLVLLAAATLVPPAIRYVKSLLVERVPWRDAGEQTHFAGASLRFVVGADTTAASPSEVPVTIQRHLDASVPIDLILWLVATDSEGRPWTLVQEQGETDSITRSYLTASIDAAITYADRDPMGNLDPYRTAHRAAKAELDVPLAQIDFVAWGRDLHPFGSRTVVLAIAGTSVPAERLAGHRYPEGDGFRRSWLTRLTPEGVTQALSSGHPDAWCGSAVYGLIEALDRYHRGSWAVVERDLAPRWREKTFFARVEKEVERATALQPR